MFCCLSSLGLNLTEVMKNLFICQLKRCPTQVINPGKQIEPEKEESSSEESSSEEETSSDEKDKEKKEVEQLLDVPKVIEDTIEKVINHISSF